MDSLILYNNNSDWLLIMWALNNRHYLDRFNDRIKYLAFTKLNLDAIKYIKKWNNSANDATIKNAMINYFSKTNFSNVGIDVYLDVMKEILTYNDHKVNNIIIEKLKKDTFWHPFEDDFLYVLKPYGITKKDIE